MGLAKFYSAVLWLGISLALMGQLKSCTRILIGLAAGKPEIMSYARFNRRLWAPAPSSKAGPRPLPIQTQGGQK